jgi:hypothetical protein
MHWIRRRKGRNNRFVVMWRLYKKSMKISIGRNNKYESKFESVLAIMSMNGGKSGFFKRSLLPKKRLAEELRHVLNHIHGSNAENTKAGYASIFKGITFPKRKTRTSSCDRGSSRDQNIPIVDPL